MGTPLAVEVSAVEVVRAARLLALRTRREATGVFAGAYASAFRGGGIEFEESRPYTPGDDVRSLDWNATARIGEPYVKRFRQERDQTLLLALDVSGSMRFGMPGSSKAAAAARGAALVAAAAGRAGDRVGLLAFADGVRTELRPARGPAHGTAVVAAAVAAASRSDGPTDLAAGLAAVRRCTPRRSVVFLLSDFRDDALLGVGSGPLVAELAATARRHDFIAVVVHDPREEGLPAAGPLCITDPERPGSALVLDSGSPRRRARYAAAAAVRRRALELALLSAGAEVLWLRSDRDPLPVLARFFRERSGRARVMA